MGTHTNFNEYLGLGLARTVGRHSALTAEYRFLHVSNGGRTKPNIGLNCSTLWLGYDIFL